MSVVDQISARFRAALSQPYRYAVQVDAQTAGTTTAAGLAVASGGQITCDRTAVGRRTVRLRVIGIPPVQLPRNGRRSPLDCYGNELVISAGIAYPRRDDVELVAQGVFRIASAKTVDTVDGIALDLTGTDRAGWLNKCRLLTPWQTPAGTTATGAITALAQKFFGVSLQIVDTSTRGGIDTFPQHVLAENANPWADGIAVFAEAVGAEVFFDRYGRLTIRDVPDLSQAAAVWQFVEGDDCTVVELDIAQDDSAPNAMVAVGETPDSAAVRAYAVDTDPGSPTYYGPDVNSLQPGGYGSRPTSLQSPLITTAGQAQAVANAQGRILFGGTETATVTIALNPALVEGDVIHVRRARSAVDDMYVVDRMPILLSPQGSQKLTCTLLRGRAL